MSLSIRRSNPGQGARVRPDEIELPTAPSEELMEIPALLETGFIPAAMLTPAEESAKAAVAASGNVQVRSNGILDKNSNPAFLGPLIQELYDQQEGAEPQRKDHKKSDGKFVKRSNARKLLRHTRRHHDHGASYRVEAYGSGGGGNSFLEDSDDEDISSSVESGVDEDLAFELSLSPDFIPPAPEIRTPDQMPGDREQRQVLNGDSPRAVNKLSEASQTYLRKKMAKRSRKDPSEHLIEPIDETDDSLEDSEGDPDSGPRRSSARRRRARQQIVN